MTTMMKAMGISRYHQKQLEEFVLPIPAIAPDEVLVEVHAASVNPVVVHIVGGFLLEMILPPIPT